MVFPFRNRTDAAPRRGIVSRATNIFPLLSLPILLYIVMSATAGQPTEAGAPAVSALLDSEWFGVPMMSGVKWRMQVGDALLLFALLMLAIEIVKATSTKSSAIINHAFSMGLLIFCLVGFLLFSNFATSLFFILTMMCLLDVLVGAMVTIVSARRDFGVGDGFGG